MAALTLAEVARMTGAAVLHGSPGLAFARYGIDSRLTAGGELFFAVPGRRDGHDFVAAAAAAGAAGAVVSRPVEPPASGFGLLLVPDTVAALQDLARGVLALHPVKVVGVTGSVGKTTTKEFAAALLAARFRVLKSEGNFNNRLGLALSVLRLEPGHGAAVLEMGMSAPGEIRELTRVAPPDVAVVTNIAPVHLEFFRDLDGIARAKKEILDGARPGAAAVLNADDPRVMAIAATVLTAMAVNPGGGTMSLDIVLSAGQIEGEPCVRLIVPATRRDEHQLAAGQGDPRVGGGHRGRWYVRRLTRGRAWPPPRPSARPSAPPFRWFPGSPPGIGRAAS